MWAKPANVVQGTPVEAPVPQLAVYLDASSVAVSQQRAFWSMASCRNNLAHKRVGVADHSEGSPLLPSSDRRQGSDVPLRQQLSICLSAEPGGHSLVAYVLPNFVILLECRQYNITLLVRHIPGRLNVLADGLSRRHQIIGTEWCLHPSVVRKCSPFDTVPSQQQAGNVCLQFQILRQ